MRGQAHRHGHGAVVGGDRHGPPPLRRLDEGPELEKGRALVVAGRRELRGHRHGAHLGHGAVARSRGSAAKALDVAAPDDPDDGVRRLGLDLSEVADGGHVLRLLVLGKHAQVQRGPGAALELHHHEGVVQDVRPLVAVDLVLVVQRLAAGGEDGHGLALRDAAHEVEEVARLLHERAAREAVEAVPVAHLDEKWKAVLPDGDHPDGAVLTAVRLLDQLRDRGHPPVLHARHEAPGLRPRLARLRLARGEHRLDLPAVGQGRAERLLAEDVLARGDDTPEDVDVRVVWRAHDNRIHKVAHDQALMVLENGAGRRPLAQLLKGLRAGPLVGVRDGHDDGHGLPEEPDVADVLLAHGARADNAHSQGRRLRRGGARERRATQRGEHAAGGLEALPRVHDERVVDEEDVALVPRKSNLALLHETVDHPERLAVDGRPVAQHDGPLAVVAGVVPAGEGGDHGVEEHPLACPLVQAEGG
mmetsp:Transcript_154523/g.474912  ORF Transcript_154523/g.474912 Transcript_154523/m.474912 type:complete len:474 (-) Transcript_154523:849-2270(-)